MHRKDGRKFSMFKSTNHTVSMGNTMGHVPSIDSNIKMFQWMEKEQNIYPLDWIPVYLSDPLLNNSTAVPEFEEVSEKRMCQERASNVNSCRRLKLSSFWTVTTFGFVRGYQRFGENYRLHLQDKNVGTVGSLPEWMSHMTKTNCSIYFTILCISTAGNTSKLNLDSTNRGR
jgi:hypothetical protein